MPSITAIITTYRRPHTLEALVAAVRGQSAPPCQLWAWANEPWEDFSAALRRIEFDRLVCCSPNAFFHGRFALALLAPTEFVAVFDDDSVPGTDWFANCLQTMAATPGILGTAGLVLDDLGSAGPSYASRTMHGWQRPNDPAVEVDLVGQAWFLRTDWVKYLFAEPAVTGTNGEDIELAARAWRLAGIRSYCPPHPPRDQRRWGSTRGAELGLDQVAASVARPSHLAERERIVRTEIEAGWKPLCIRR
ncbi:MAG TPA: hypothetical protein VND64_11455 [Pirellulales bacterium]|nr:hypothetical protein [Pirellulales bacterium]